MEYSILKACLVNKFVKSIYYKYGMLVITNIYFCIETKAEAEFV